ncbi:hypothetical protein [Mesorhizobium sp. CO1-1-8]|uniref:hypothetical protein n=1 Tax=Mesorhizobium sp. CO1-1-8 TaxID=2876631 RepID=UPI001CD0B76D|nr:hypothetical protein [Mesorhizobium sp. CO1-1-8]MBZ9775036.1 hypothetical protein [Mesorhizobium sp. CO1-1-8]
MKIAPACLEKAEMHEFFWYKSCNVLAKAIWTAVMPGGALRNRFRLVRPAVPLLYALATGAVPTPSAAAEFDGAEITISDAVDVSVYFRKGALYLTQVSAFDAFADDVTLNAVRIPQSGGKGCRKYRDSVGGRPGRHCYEVRQSGEGRWHIVSSLHASAGGGYPSDRREMVLEVTVGAGEDNCKARLVSSRREYFGISRSRQEDVKCYGGSTPPRPSIIEILDRKYLR